MRARRMAWIVVAVCATLTAVATVLAQAESGQGPTQLVERPFTYVFEYWVTGIDWAGEVPFSGAKSEFGGRCSVPSDWVIRGRVEGTASIGGPVVGTAEHCAQVTWGVDADGAPSMLGLSYSDAENAFIWPDGSSLSGTMIDMGSGFDAETGETTGAMVTMFTSGTGRFEGASAYALHSARIRDVEANMAGMEPAMMVGQGAIRYDPHAAAGE